MSPSFDPAVLDLAVAAARRIDSSDLQRLQEIEAEIRAAAKPLADATEASERITREDLAVRITVRD